MAPRTDRAPRSTMWLTPRIAPMDRLSLLLHRFSLSAGVFYTGHICGIHHFERDSRRGHVHLVKRGPVTLTGCPEGTLKIAEPTLLFLPRPGAHRLIANDRDGADVVCASIQFGGGGHNPITDSLPPLVHVPLAELHGAQALLELFYDEAFAEHCGRQAALDRLCELLLIRLLRYCLDHGLTQGGTLAGLAAGAADDSDFRGSWSSDETAPGLGSASSHPGRNRVLRLRNGGYEQGLGRRHEAARRAVGGAAVLRSRGSPARALNSWQHMNSVSCAGSSWRFRR